MYITILNKGPYNQTVTLRLMPTQGMGASKVIAYSMGEKISKITIHCH